MSSENIRDLKAHFLTTKQFNDKQSPAANELWFTKMPHWLNYNTGSCLGITTQPTASGNEIDFYAGASFVVHCGKYADGTNKNQIVDITEDKYITVNSSGGYCFDENGNIVTGEITYDSTTNKVSVNGTEGNYSQKVQSYTYSDGIVTLEGTVKPLVLGCSATFLSNEGNWALDFGSAIMQGGKSNFNYGESYSYITFPVPMNNTDYTVQISNSSYYQIGVSLKTTTGVALYTEDIYETVNYTWQVVGSK